jgi:hypothetical protein
MKTKSKKGLHRFQLKLPFFGNPCYIDRIVQLEKALAKKPRTLQLDMIGGGEIPADLALLMRSILNQRSPKTRLITNARTSLQNGSVLVWLMGDTRLIRDNARIFFRRAVETGQKPVELVTTWKELDPVYSDSFSEVDPDETDYAGVLELIDEFLPAKEFAGRVIGLPVLRQFGLVDNEKLDQFLAGAFRKPQVCGNDTPAAPQPKRSGAVTIVPEPKQANE